MYTALRLRYVVIPKLCFYDPTPPEIFPFFLPYLAGYLKLLVNIFISFLQFVSGFKNYCWMQSYDSAEWITIIFTVNP